MGYFLSNNSNGHHWKSFIKLQKESKSTQLLQFIAFIGFIALPFLPEKMEKGVILEAHLNEERSSWNIKIFENNNYRIRRSGLGGFKDYEGKYLLKNDTLTLESFDCNQCNFNNEWLLGDKSLIPLNSNTDYCYGCFEIVYRK